MLGSGQDKLRDDFIKKWVLFIRNDSQDEFRKDVYWLLSLSNNEFKKEISNKIAHKIFGLDSWL